MAFEDLAALLRSELPKHLAQVPTQLGIGWIPVPSAEGQRSSKSYLDLFAKAFEEGLDRGHVAEAFARCEVEREDDLLKIGLAQGVEVEMPGQLSSEPAIGVLDAALLPAGVSVAGSCR